jgi:hypothetical protein
VIYLKVMEIGLSLHAIYIASKKTTL